MERNLNQHFSLYLPSTDELQNKKILIFDYTYSGGGLLSAASDLEAKNLILQSITGFLKKIPYQSSLLLKVLIDESKQMDSDSYATRVYATEALIQLIHYNKEVYEAVSNRIDPEKEKDEWVRMRVLWELNESKLKVNEMPEVFKLALSRALKAQKDSGYSYENLNIEGLEKESGISEQN